MTTLVQQRRIIEVVLAFLNARELSRLMLGLNSVIDSPTFPMLPTDKQRTLFAAYKAAQAQLDKLENTEVKQGSRTS